MFDVNGEFATSLPSIENLTLVPPAFISIAYTCQFVSAAVDVFPEVVVDVSDVFITQFPEFVPCVYVK